MLTQTTAMRSGFSTQQPLSGRRPSPAAATHALVGSIDMMGASMTFARNSEIYGENEPADYLYKLISGTVRTYKVLSDGRRQIGAFYLPGDMFGLETGEEHSFSAEAITDAKVLVIKRSAVMALAERDGDVARQLWALTSRELRRVQDHIMLLIKTAQERVVSFLLEMAARVPGCNAVELPMSRQDIADYLGLTIETVSRTLTHLENTAAIELPSSRRIVLRNRTALGRLNG
jgi:CRP/FNR family transcriptional regulator, nitrogen fixation regulation protein